MATLGDFSDHTIFSGALPSQISIVRKMGFAVLRKALMNIPEASIMLPCRERAQQLAQAGSKFTPQLTNIIGAIDGKFASRERDAGSGTIKKSKYYCTHYKSHGVKQLCLFLFDGTIGMVSLNSPGSFHYSKVYKTMKVLERMTAHGLLECKIVGDTAFGVSPVMIRPLSETELASLPEESADLARMLNGFISGLRVPSEWGIGGLTKSGQS